jgi:hypothetical protein
VKILNKLKKSNGVRFGLCLAACLLGSRAARAEVELAEKDGWVFSFDGRVNAFLSAGFGQDIPRPSAMGTHRVMGDDSAASNGVPDSGWPANFGQAQVNGDFLNIRVRSGMYGNILGFGIARKISDTTVVKGYISLWSTIESLGQDKWAPVGAEAREGYLNASGNWGALRVGRMLGWVGRMSYEIDTVYAHGFGVGLPCTDALGPACGHIGTGALHPGYSAGILYSTPSLGGLQLHVGVYDPIVFGAGTWTHAPIVRPEGAITFDRPIGQSARIKFEVEGFWQPLARLEDVRDPVTGVVLTQNRFTTEVWAAAGGLRIEVGPVRLGVSGFRGKGTGLFYALQKTQPIEDLTHQLRMFSGAYVQGALVFGGLRLMSGFGMALVDQTANDKINTMLSVIRYQRGISAGVFYNATDSIVLGLDYFMFAAGWWGAPTIDPVTMATGKLAGEKQVVNFVNAGITYYW